MNDTDDFGVVRMPIEYMGEFGQHGADEPCASPHGWCPCRPESMIAAARGRGEVCPVQVLATGEDDEGQTHEQVIHCNLLVGHEGQHQATVSGGGTDRHVSWQILRW